MNKKAKAEAKRSRRMQRKQAHDNVKAPEPADVEPETPDESN